MALRSLSTEILFRDKATQALQGVDTEIDGIRDGIEGTQGDFSDLSHETGEFAYSAKSDMVDVGSGVDDLSHKTGGFRDMMSRAGGAVQRNWNMIAGAVGGAGVAMEAFARQQQEMIETSERIAYSTGIQAGEVRELAVEMHDATFDLEDVYGLMDLGRRQGMESAEQLQEYAEFWDMVGDATGENSVELARASVALRAVGIEAGEEEQALGAFGFITQETTGSVSDFLYFLERTGPELREMGMGVDDAAAITGALERELGMTARTARQEFRRAVNEAEGDSAVLLETLGLTEEQMVNYQSKVEDSSGAIEDLAQIHYDSITPAQHLQAEIQGLTHQYGAHLMPIIEMASPVLMGLATVMGIVAGAKYLGAGAAIAFGKGLLVAGVAVAGVTAPVWLLIAAIAAAATGIYFLVTEWEAVIGWLKGVGSTLYDIGADIIRGLAEGIRKGIDFVWSAIKGVGETITGGIRNIFGINSPATLMIEYGGYIGEGLHVGMEEESEDFFARARNMFSPDRERVQAAGSFSPVVNIEVNGGGSPDETARAVDRRLRQTFDRYAERYFSRQRRKK